MSDGNISTKNLRRTLGRKELFSVAVGQIIGAGVFALTGIAIAMTGRSVNLAFLLSAIAVIGITIPVVFLASTIRLRGGQYTQASIFVGKKFAGTFIIIYIVANISLAMFAISFAEYFFALVPAIPSKLVAVTILTIVFIINYFGIFKATIIQVIMVLILAIALALFTGFGLFQVQPGYFQNPGFMTDGVTGLFTAMALLTFATSGAVYILNLSAEAKNAKKDIPYILILSTAIVAILYALLSTVAAGVLPVSEVAGKPLTLVAEEILPDWLYVFFIIGGAMFALLTTLNAQVSWVTKPVMQASVDNWFPKSLAKLHPKYNTPYLILLLFYLVGIIPVLTGLDIEAIASASLLLSFVACLILAFGLFRLPKLFPEQWENSAFYVSKFWFYFFNIFCILILLFQTVLLTFNLDIEGVIMIAFILVVAVVFGIVRSGKVDMENSVDND